MKELLKRIAYRWSMALTGVVVYTIVDLHFNYLNVPNEMIWTTGDTILMLLVWLSPFMLLLISWYYDSIMEIWRKNK